MNLPYCNSKWPIARRLSVPSALAGVLLFTLSTIAASPRASRMGSSSSPSIQIVGVTIVNVNALGPSVALRTDTTILIQKGRIAIIRPTTEEDVKNLSRSVETHPGGPPVQVIDGRGLFAVPGLIDTHVHLDWSGDEAAMLKLFLANGITTVLDTGNSPQRVFPLRKKVARGELLGPRIEACGAAITSTPAAWRGMTVVSTPNQVRQAVRERAMQGAKFVKIYAQLPPELSRVLIQSAHSRGMRVIGHIGRTNAMEATQLGIDIITHLSGIPDAALADPEAARKLHARGFSEGWQASNAAWQNSLPEALLNVIRQMIAGHAALSPTLYFQKIFATLGQPSQERKEAVEFSHAPQSILKDWETFTMEVGDPKIYSGAWPLQLRFVKSFYDAGGLLIAGTDTPNQYVAPGFGLHQEMETLVEAGLSPFAALKAATVNASRALGLEEEVGSVEMGMRADLLLLERNPLDDMKNARKIKHVIQNGRTFEPKGLLSGLPH